MHVIPTKIHGERHECIYHNNLLSWWFNEYWRTVLSGNSIKLPKWYRQVQSLMSINYYPHNLVFLSRVCIPHTYIRSYIRSVFQPEATSFSLYFLSLTLMNYMENIRFNRLVISVRFIWILVTDVCIIMYYMFVWTGSLWKVVVVYIW